MSKMIRTRHNGHTITTRVNEESSTSKIRARSKRHAKRIMNDLGLYGYDGGVGMPFRRVYLSGGYVVVFDGVDC